MLSRMRMHRLVPTSAFFASSWLGYGSNAQVILIVTLYSLSKMDVRSVYYISECKEERSVRHGALGHSDTNTTAQHSSRTRLPGVDVLRGLCILSVVLHHIHLRFTTNKYHVNDVLPATVNQVLFWSGLYAVIAFFVISGFLITGLSIRRWGSLKIVHPGRFYRMRIARIAPCLLLILAVLSALHFLSVPGAEMNPHRASLMRTLAAALTFHMNWLEGHYGWSPPAWGILWSLSIEEVFYLAFPVVCLLLRREKLLPFALLVVIVAGPINRVIYANDQPWGAYAYLSCMDGMAFGCLAALVSARITLSARVLRMSLVAGAVIALLVLVFCNEDDYSTGLARYGLNFTVLEIGIAMMLVPLGSGIGNRTMSVGTSWLRALGQRSYEIYLFHMLPLIGFIAWFKRDERTGIVIVATYAAMLLGSVALGFLVSRYFSEPLNRWLRGNEAEQRKGMLVLDVAEPPSE
jgi:peptidoglycan/LPS O-acetylase OafA/YrhL